MNVSEFSPDSKDYRQVKIVIGGDGFFYSGVEPHFEITGTDEMSEGALALLLPQSVAEYFKNQGRRELQAELRRSLNSARA